jgi:phosphoglycolate phosphatase
MTTKTRFDLIVFDWDGTLMDSEAKIVNCIAAAAADCGLADPGRAASRHIIGLGLQEALRALFPSVPASDRQRVAERYREHFLQHDQTETQLFPGVAAGLEELAEQGYLLAVATGKSRRGLQRVLEETGTEKLFIATRCADETSSKPHPQMLHEILDVTGMTADRAVMVGDTTYDMQMARNAAMAGLAVSYGAHARELLLEHTPMACVDSFADVCAWLD